jgi:hypothetical protein
MADLSVFGKIKTIDDYRNAERQFQLAKSGDALKKRLMIEQLKANKNDPERIAQDAIFNYYKTGQIDPDGLAAIKTAADMKGSKTSYSPDALGNVRAVTQPNSLQQFLSMVGGAQEAQQTPQQSMQQTSMPEQDFGADPFANSYQGMDGKNSLPPIPQDMQPQRLPNLNPAVANSPQGLLEAYKSQLKMNEKSSDPLTQLKIDEFNAKQDEKEEKVQQRQRAKQETAQTVTQDIKRAINILNSGGIMPKAGTAGELLSPIGETPSGQITDLVKTVKANIGFDKLQAMREASPTGGALGQVSEMENRLLQATQGNLEIGQKPEQLDMNLKRIYNKYMDTIHGTPDEIRDIAQQIGLDPKIVQSLSFRYPLSFDEFGDNIEAQGEDIQDLMQYMTPEERALF